MPFNEHRIKFLLREKTGKNLTENAQAWGCRLEELSMCIRQCPGRIYPALRLVISATIGIEVDRVFGRHPLTDALLEKMRTKSPRRRAA